MQSYPAGWEKALNSLHRKEIKVSIAAIDYIEKELISVSTKADLYSSGTVSIGGCVAKEIDLVVRPKGSIPRMAEIRVYVRLVGDGVATDWLPKGVYYIDTRKTDYSTGIMTIHGYDAMLKAEQVYLGEVDLEPWPQSMNTVAVNIANRMGLVLDPRTKINAGLLAAYPLGLTMREMLGYIAVANAGNWVITDTGTLRLVPLKPSATVDVDVGMNAISMDTAPALAAITGVRLWKDDETAYFAGDTTGYVLEADCPWVTNAMAASVLNELSGYAYQPYDAKGAAVDVAAELGDTVSIGGVVSVIAYADTNYDPLCPTDIGAPADEELDHEYPYLTKQERESARVIVVANSAKSQADNLTNRVVKAETNITKNSEQIALRATKKELAEGLGNYYDKDETEALVQLQSDFIIAAVRGAYSTKEETESLVKTESDRSTSLHMDNRAMILETIESLVKTSDYEEFKKSTETQLSLVPGQIDMSFRSASEQINGVDGDLQSKFTELYKYLHFRGETAITIGSGNSAITLEIDNETGIAFRKNGEQIGLWDGDNFYTGNIVVKVNERAQFGNFAWIPRSDGSLVFGKVGG